MACLDRRLHEHIEQPHATSHNLVLAGDGGRVGGVAWNVKVRAKTRAVGRWCRCGHHSGRLAFVCLPQMSARLPPPRPKLLPPATNSQVILAVFKGGGGAAAALFGLRQKPYAGRRAAT